MEEETKQNNNVHDHRHNGLDSQKIDFSDIQGFIRTVDVVPTWTPRSINEQVAIYNGVTVYRFYWYDSLNNEWRFATGT